MDEKLKETEELFLTNYFTSNDKKLFQGSHMVFYEDDITNRLVDPETNENISQIEFNEKIKLEVSKFMNEPFENVVVLAGAGASVVSNDTGIDSDFGKTVAMIAEDIAGKLNVEDDLFSLQELAFMSNYKEAVFCEECGQFNNKFDLEEFLSNLLTFEQFVDKKDEDKLISSKNKIFDCIIENTNYGYDNEKLRHAALLKVLSKRVKDSNKLTVVTTNYDTLFEEASEYLGFTVIDGFTFSYNPYFDSDIFEWNLVKSIPHKKTNELEYKKNIINLLKIHGSLTWEYSEYETRINRKDKLEVKTPIMIFPSSNKYMQSYENPYFELFSKFQELLRRPNTLLVTTGFSFADNHIAKMVIQALKHNTGLTVLVSDYDIQQNHQNWKDLDGLRREHFRIAFLKASLNDKLDEYLK